MEVAFKKWLRTFWKYLKVQYFKATLNLVSTFFQSYHNSQGTGSSPSGMGGIGILPWSGVGMASLPPHPRRCDGQGKPRNLSEEKDVGFSRCVWYWVESRLRQTPKIVFFKMTFSCGENGIDKNEQQSDHLHIIKRLKKVILRLSAQTNLSNLCLALDQLLLHSWLKPPKHLQNSPERYSFPRPPSHVARKSFWPFCVGRISQLGPPFFGWKENKKQSTICWEAIGLEVPCVSTYFSSLGQWTLN